MAVCVVLARPWWADVAAHLVQGADDVVLRTPRRSHQGFQNINRRPPAPEGATGMDRDRPRLDKSNIVSGNVDTSIAFYRRLGVEIAEDGIWRTPTGIHHVGAASDAGDSTMQLDIDSIAFARLWNSGWQGAANLRGRVVVGFSVRSRTAFDTVYSDLTGAGFPGLQAPYDAIWGSRYAVLEDPDGIAVGLMSPPSADHRSPPPQV